MNKTAKKSFNGWKWAFFVLLAAIIIGGAVVVHKAAAPAPAPEVSRPVQATDTSLTVALNRKQVNALSANYLNQFLKGERVK